MTTQEDPGRRMAVADIAALVGGRVIGDPSVQVQRVAPLEEAGPGDLTLLAAGKYARHLEGCGASALLVSEALAGTNPERVATRVVCEDAHRALAALLDHWYPASRPAPGVHPTAVLEPGVRLGEGVSVGPYAVVEADADLGDRVVVGAHACVGAGVTIGADSTLYPQVVVYPGAQIGRRVILHAGARVGVDGFGYVLEGGAHRKVPQVGRCIIGDDVEIGANTCLDRGSIGDTVVEAGAKLDNLVHLGHNVRVGAASLLAAMVGVAGSSRVGRGVAAGGQVGISGHLTIGDGARLGAQAGIIGDVPPGETVSGYPARPHRAYLKGMSQVFKLPELAARLKRVEAALDRLESSVDGDH